jgi:hypothetical protein
MKVLYSSDKENVESEALAALLLTIAHSGNAETQVPANSAGQQNR